MVSVPARLAAIAAERQAELARRSRIADPPPLREFLIGAWENVLHPSETLELHGAWYIDLICEWLTVVTIGTLLRLEEVEVANKLLKPYGLTTATLDESLRDVRQLLINISPRCSKSTIVTVCWPCWEWLAMPWLTYMCMSYDQSLASDHNDDRRSIIQSEWYQTVSGGMGLSNSKNRITEFKNDRQGQMVARGLNAGVTGGGGMRIICLPYNQVISTLSGDLEIGSIVENRIDVEIQTFNHETGQIEYQPILAYEKGEYRPLIRMTIGDRSIVCTEDHPIFVEGKGYVRADEVKLGDVVLVND